MTATGLLVRLATVRQVRERQALRALAEAVRAAEANRALAMRVDGLLAAGVAPGPRNAHAHASAAAGRDQLRAVQALLAVRQTGRDALRQTRAQQLGEAAAATQVVEARLAQTIDEEAAA